MIFNKTSKIRNVKIDWIKKMQATKELVVEEGQKSTGIDPMANAKVCNVHIAIFHHCRMKPSNETYRVDVGFP